MAIVNNCKVHIVILVHHALQCRTSQTEYVLSSLAESAIRTEILRRKHDYGGGLISTICSARNSEYGLPTRVTQMEEAWLNPALSGMGIWISGSIILVNQNTLVPGHQWFI